MFDKLLKKLTNTNIDQFLHFLEQKGITQHDIRNKVNELKLDFDQISDHPAILLVAIKHGHEGFIYDLILSMNKVQLDKFRKYRFKKEYSMIDYAFLQNQFKIANLLYSKGFSIHKVVLPNIKTILDKTNLVKEYRPNSLFAYSIKSNYHTGIFKQHIKLLQDIAKKQNRDCVSESKKYLKYSDSEIKKVVYDADANPEDKNMNKLRCLVYSYLQTIQKKVLNNTEQIGSLTHSGFQEYFTPLNKISEGTFGATYLCGLKKIKDAIVLKVPKSGIDPFHEIVIGMVLNDIRSTTFGFNYCLGGFYCGSNELELLQKVPNSKFPMQIDLCQDDVFTSRSEQHIFSLWEFIPVQQSEFVVSPFILLDFQLNFWYLLHSLSLAQDKFKFMHNDLHCKNILLRKNLYTSNDISVHMTQPSPKYGYMKTIPLKTIPMIIDFGRSNLEFQNNSICSMEEFLNDQYFKQFNSVTCNTFNPFYDILLFTFSLLSKESTSPSYISIAKTCLSYFMNEPNFPTIDSNVYSYRYKPILEYIVKQIPNWYKTYGGWNVVWDLVYGTRSTYIYLKKDYTIGGIDIRYMWDDLSKHNKMSLKYYKKWFWNEFF